MKRCPRCRIEKPLASYARNKANPGQIQSYCRSCSVIKKRESYWRCRATSIARSKRWQARLKAETIAAYGGSCVCCGERESEFLSIDHIHGDGAKERKAHGFNGGGGLYGRLKKAGWPKDRYRLLCFNCNMARGHFGYCPHERKRIEAMEYK